MFICPCWYCMYMRMLQSYYLYKMADPELEPAISPNPEFSAGQQLYGIPFTSPISLIPTPALLGGISGVHGLSGATATGVY